MFWILSLVVLSASTLAARQQQDPLLYSLPTYRRVMEQKNLEDRD